MEPLFTLSDFHRDFVLGDKGDDVKKFQEMLLYYGKEYDEKTQKEHSYTALQREIDENVFGKETEAEAERLRKERALHPELFQNEGIGQFLKMLLTLVFQIDPEELNAENQTGKHSPIRNYGGADNAQLKALGAVAKREHPTSSMAANIALQYVGQREQAGNRGPLVKLFCGQENVPWCGGFVDYAMKQAYGTDPKIFGQENPLGAKGYLEYAQRQGAALSRNETPHVGDVVVFGRQGGGHVGIVTGVTDGVVSYVAGNTGSAVRESSYSLANPPQSLKGYANTEELAAKRGVALQKPAYASDYVAQAVSKHSDVAFARG